MSTNADEQARAKTLEDFLIMADITIKVGRKLGLSSEFIETGFKNRLHHPPTVVGGDVAASATSGNVITLARERLGFKVNGLDDFKEARKRLGLPETQARSVKAKAPAESIPADWRPESGPHAGWGAAISELVRSGTLFQQRLAAGLIPPGEVEEARKGGLSTWRRLRDKYGDPNLAVPDRRFGGAA